MNKFLHKILLPAKKNYIYPLLDNGLSKSDLYQGIKVLRSGRITMDKKTMEFEKKFAKKLRIKYALMVNSGSSANLLAAFASCNPKRKKRLELIYDLHLQGWSNKQINRLNMIKHNLFCLM